MASNNLKTSIKYMGNRRGGQVRGSRGMDGRGQWRGRGRGERRPDGVDSAEGSRSYSSQKDIKNKPLKVRPTHFLCLPLHNHPHLRKRIAAFQAALFDDYEASGVPSQACPRQVRHSTLVEGLDSTIVINPVRMHMTLGVMALEENGEEGTAGMTPMGTSFRRAASPDLSTPAVQRKTVSTALGLLKSLSPQISAILKGSKAVKVPLEVMDVFKTEKMRSQGQGGEQFGKPSVAEGNDSEARKKGKQPERADYCDRVGAGVLFIAPREMVKDAMDEERQKLIDICELVSRTFKDHGYLTDNRPLKLHCTILNASYRKPARWCPFSYADIRDSRACGLLTKGVIEGNPETHLIECKPSQAGIVKTPVGSIMPPPIPINLGTWDVHEVQLWKMGSRDNEGKYISCGGIKLGE